MRMLLRLILATLLLASINSCSDDHDDEPELECDQYYLDTYSGTQVFYYADNKVSEYVFEGDTIVHFTYNASGKLEWMLTQHGYKEHYVYDEANRLGYVIKYFTDSSPDSLALEYNGDDLISQITYYTFDNVMRTEQYSYTGSNATEVIIHNMGFDPGTFRFEYDNNPVPWPHETLPFNYVFQDGSLGENNVTKQIVITADGEEYATKYSYRYNSDGYPMRLVRASQTFTYTYRCTPRLRGTLE